MPENFQRGLFDCVNIPNFAASLFCPCCATFLVSKGIGGNGIGWAILGCFLPWISVCCLRMQVRDVKNIGVKKFIV